MPTTLSGSLRDKILAAARRIVTEEGYSALSMRRLAGTIDCSATAIYLHFENKDELIHALIDEGMEGLHARLLEAVAETMGRARRLEAILRAYATWGIENPEYYEIMFMLHPRPMAPYPADRYRRAKRNLDLISAVLMEGEGKKISADSALVMATTAWSVVHGAVALRIAGRIDVSVPSEAVTEGAVKGALATLGVDDPYRI